MSSQVHHITLIISLFLAPFCKADIFQWDDSVSPPFPGQPRQARESTTLCPDGAGVDAIPGADLSDRNLYRAYLANKNLTGANLTGANLTQALLDNADLTGANLEGTDFSGAQFNSTVIDESLRQANLWGDSSANFFNISLTNINLSGIRLKVSLKNCSFANSTLTNSMVSFNMVDGNDMSNVDLNSSYVRVSQSSPVNWQGASFDNSIFQNSWMDGTFKDVSFKNTVFFWCITYNVGVRPIDFTGADFSNADLRSVGDSIYHYITNSTAILHNTIRPDGTMPELNIQNGEKLSLNPGFEIKYSDGSINLIETPDVRVESSMQLSQEGGVCFKIGRFLTYNPDNIASNIGADKITFEEGIPVELNGILELVLSPHTTPEDIIGMEFQIFDWTGVNPTGQFSQISIDSNLVWNTSRLYSEGVVSLKYVDNDSDGISDSWEEMYFGSTSNANPSAVCSNGVNTVLQAFIAGFDPNNPNSEFTTSILPENIIQWSCVSGRIYSVYWTTNLFDSFQPLETNIPWTCSSFTNSTDTPNAYFKIGVQLDD